MTRVLAAIDPSSGAPAVLVAAGSLAALAGAGVTAIHVRTGDGLARVREDARRAGVELVVRDGAPVAGIVAAATAEDVVAVVIGARGRSGAGRLTGQTAIEVLAAVAKPVVVVPPGHPPPARIDRMLVPLEGSEEGSAAVAGALTLAVRRGVKVEALHVHAPTAVPAFADHAGSGEAWGREFTARFAPAPDEVDLVRRTGEAAECIGGAITETDADLVVLAWGRDLGAGRAQVVRRALAHSRVPVLLVPVA